MNALVIAMQAPGFYPHATAQPIKVVQTHISYVFLTGEYAYKIKKAVNLGFLDFTTVDLRKHFCEEELRLNKIFAPDLYVGVVPIYQRGGKFRLEGGGSGEIVEYAVKMRQFRDEDLLTNVFKRDELTESHIEGIATQLAEHHRKALTNSHIASNGTPEAISKTVTEILSNVERFLDATITEKQYDQVKAYCVRFIEDHRNRMLERLQAGKIRECHGDLHLNNICFYRGRIEFFDRIEFNDAFKNIDVISDASFLYMDLEFRLRRDLANRFINVYLEETGDFKAALLLPFYACCRALIRGEVLSMQLEEEETAPDEMPHIKEKAGRYFDLACSYVPDRPGRVVLMCGLSGTGKSTVARELAKRIDAIHIRSDAVRKHLAGVGLHDRSADIYTDEMTERTYRRMIAMGVEIASNGTDVILDAKYDRRSTRDYAIEESQRNHLGARILHCTAPPDIVEGRLNARRKDISDADASLQHQQQQAFESLDEEERRILTEVDTQAQIDFDALVASLD